MKAAPCALALALFVAACTTGASSPPASPGGPAQPSPTPRATVATSPAAVAPCDAPAGRSTDVPWTADGVSRSALVHPSAKAATGPDPIVIVLHGYGGFGLEIERISELSDAADERGWFVVYPQGIGQPQEWSYATGGFGHGNDIAFIRQIVTDLAAAGCGDSKRVIVAGISQGGWLSDMVGCELSDLVVGVVSVAARDFGWSCSPARPVAFTAVSGVLDEVLPYDGGPVNAPPPITEVGSVDDWLAARATSRACTGEPKEQRVSDHVVVERWSGCVAPVALYRVEDGGHSWPSGGGFPPVDHELSVTDIIAAMLDGSS
jgi:polyhydroxybutyrate depolymerase